MDGLPGATSLARALLALARSGATGRLSVTAPCGSAHLAIVGGTPRALSIEPGVGDTLGDLLLREGSIDPEAHHRALAFGRIPAMAVGRWLIATGVASPPAVAHALRVQLRRRLRHVFRWPAMELRFEQGSSDIGVELIDEPVAPADLVISAMRELVAEVPLEAVRRSLGEGFLELTPLGHSLLQAAALLPVEAVLVALLRQGQPVETLLSVAGYSGQALRSLYLLKLLRAAADRKGEGRAYPLLLRKQGQLRRTEDPRALLDLADNAGPNEARRALRRLASELHPDRFDRDDPELRRASNEVLSALVRAEARMRKSGHCART